MIEFRWLHVFVIITVTSILLFISYLVNDKKNARKATGEVVKTDSEKNENQNFPEGTVSGTAQIRPTCPTPALLGQVNGQIPLNTQASTDKKTKSKLPLPPEIWLEFRLDVTVDGKNKDEKPMASGLIKVRLSAAAEQAIAKLWSYSCTYYYIAYLDEKKFDVEDQAFLNLVSANGWCMESTARTQIDAPDGKRCISDEEAGKMVELINLLARAEMKKLRDAEKAHRLQAASGKVAHAHI